MLQGSSDTCQRGIVTRIQAADNPTAVFGPEECPLISEFLSSDAFDMDKVGQMISQDFGSEIID